jgi:hypothetical protein
MDYPLTESPWINEVLKKAIDKGVAEGIQERLPLNLSSGCHNFSAFRFGAPPGSEGALPPDA